MASYGYDEERDRTSPQTELRIHGIGGSTPERLLRDRDPVLVGGDEIAGFYRHRDRSMYREAYAWGGLTARANVRAFWILLLPFALVNVAGWMIGPSDSRWRKWHEGVLRAIAVGSTVAMTGLLAAAVVDLVALQCGLQESCADRSVALRWLRSGVLLDQPTRLLVVGLVPPVLALIVLSLLGRRTRERYEERLRLDQELPESLLDNRLAHPKFWDGKERVEALAGLHIAAALFALSAAAEWYYFRVERYQRGIYGEFEGPVTQWFTGVQAVGVVAVVLLVVTVVVALWPSVQAHEWWAGRARPVALAVFAVVAVDGLRRDARFGSVPCVRTLEQAGLSDCAHLTGTWFAGFTWSMVFVPLLGLLLVALGWGLADRVAAGRDTPERHLVMFGAGPTVAVVTGLIVLTSVMAGIALSTAALLGDRPGSGGSPPYIRVFTDWDLVSLGLVFYLATLLAWVLQRSVRIRYPRHERTGRIDRIDREYGGTGDTTATSMSSERRRWLEEIDRHRLIRSQWMPVVARPLGTGVAVAIGIAVGYLLDREIWGGDVFLEYVFVEGRAWTELLLAISRWVIVVLPGVAVLLLWRSFRNPEVRRNVGTLWDVLTFWPRWFHPFAPPAYPARAVPELVIRMQDRLVEHGPVVLSAHSQGSVIAVSAVLALGGRARPRRPEALASPATGRDTATEPVGSPVAPTAAQNLAEGTQGAAQLAAQATLDRLALLTHGSPLSSLYGRFFPAYFSTDRLRQAADLLANDDGTIRWTNLYRCTDPIGLPLFGDDRCPGGPDDPCDDEIDECLPDPVHEPPAPGDPFPTIRGHSIYYLEDDYEHAVGRLYASLSGQPGKEPPRQA